MRICICAATYNRLEGLERLLNGIGNLRFKKVDPPYVKVVIVDNDSSGRARALCNSLSLNYRWQLDCCIEQRRGISYARNSAIENTGNVDCIAFIDDDEVPGEYWLDELLYVKQLYNADVVTGPVIPRFYHEVPIWITNGRFFERERFETGQELGLARTGNVLISAGVFKRLEKWFDERFSVIGGGDTHFFMRVHQAGCKIVWADDATVYEWNPKSRVNVRWILQRAYGGANTYTMIRLDLNPSIGIFMERLAKGIVRLVQGLLGLPFSLFRGKAEMLKAIQKMFLGFGTLAGLIGIVHKEYRETH